MTTVFHLTSLNMPFWAQRLYPEFSSGKIRTFNDFITTLYYNFEAEVIEEITRASNQLRALLAQDPVPTGERQIIYACKETEFLEKYWLQVLQADYQGLAQIYRQYQNTVLVLDNFHPSVKILWWPGSIAYFESEFTSEYVMFLVLTSRTSFNGRQYNVIEEKVRKRSSLFQNNTPLAIIAAERDLNLPLQPDPQLNELATYHGLDYYVGAGGLRYGFTKHGERKHFRPPEGVKLFYTDCSIPEDEFDLRVYALIYYRLQHPLHIPDVCKVIGIVEDFQKEDVREIFIRRSFSSHPVTICYVVNKFAPDPFTEEDKARARDAGNILKPIASVPEMLLTVAMLADLA